MAVRVNPRLIGELERYGAEDVTNCYHCGNCSAVCPFSKEPYIFPRKTMRYLQVGLEKRLQSNLEPWLCYYCGECSEECPRDAEPGETMMSLRRWLTARYDFTGLSRLFYRSWKAELLAIVVVALLTGLGFSLVGALRGNFAIYDGPGAFLPSSMVHWFDWGMAAILVILLGTNAARMWWFTTGSIKEIRIPIGSYISRAFLIPYHFLSQRRYAQCSRKRPWAIHLALMLSYVIMLVLIMFFLHRMQSGPAIRWSVHAFGYAAAFGLMFTVIFALRGRIKKAETHYKHSHETDWIFLILLLLVTSTGILQHVFHRSDLNEAANVVYVVHLMVVVPMLVLEVPFGKWAHLAYRPLAMYLSDLQARAAAKQQSVPAVGSRGRLGEAQAA